MSKVPDAPEGARRWLEAARNQAPPPKPGRKPKSKSQQEARAKGQAKAKAKGRASKKHPMEDAPQAKAKAKSSARAKSKAKAQPKRRPRAPEGERSLRSRKSSAYHFYRKDALQKGKSDDEARRIGREASGLLAV